ncbi:MAG: hypothetical protein IJC27_10160 [Lentisphaeria bacterium]|nr:hypothetical protein [Lentisphaeria bacterium]
MERFFLPALIIGAGALAAFLLKRKPVAAAVAGCGALTAGALSALALTFFTCTAYPRSDIFLLPVLILALAAGFHSLGYLSGHGSERSGYYWCFFDLTVLAMIFVTQAQTSMQFLLAWEIMGAASFALVIFDRESVKAWSAGWIYLIACHAGAAFLITVFCFPLAPAVLFTLALIGFGLKIGFPLLHVWLPEAHPAAPAPVSAIMSGAMIELGFLGLLTYGIFMGANWMLAGWVLTVLGIITAVGGIIFAVAQSNLKKLLAYSSIENMGILSTALGLGLLGKAYHLDMLMVSGFAGAGAHLMNHALLKGGLFLAAGSVFKATGTLDMDEMGGLLKRMPRTGTFFIFHGLSLCGLPPSSGFAAEFLIYTAALVGVTSGITPLIAVSAAALVFTALTGGVAAAAFAKAIGAVFCGEPRSEKAANAGEVSMCMRMPVVMLFLASFALMIALPFALDFVGKNYFPIYVKEFQRLSQLTSAVAFFSCCAVALVALFTVIHKMLVCKSGQRVSITWDCGYAKPSAKMEYTATSFSRSIVDFFGFLLRPERKTVPVKEVFPENASIEENIEDGGISRFWQPVFSLFGKAADKIHVLQSGSLHFYLLVLVITLLVMLGFAVIKGN